MKRVSFASSLLLLSAIACSKPDTGAAGAATGSAASIATGAPAAASAKPTATPYTQKGIAPGKIIVGYLNDPTDPSQCIVVTDTPDKKDSFTKNADKLAAMFKAKVATSCPTTNVVGTCSPGFSMLVNYYSPKWTAESGKKDCTSKPLQTWVE